MVGTYKSKMMTTIAQVLRFLVRVDKEEISFKNWLLVCVNLDRSMEVLPKIVDSVFEWDTKLF